MALKEENNNIQNNILITSLFSIVILLIGIGFGFSYSINKAINVNGNYKYVIEQIFHIAIALVVMITAIFINVDNYKRFMKIITILTIVLLIVTLIPSIGKVVGGARRWIDLKFIQFQPSELAKIAVLIYLSAVLSRKEKKIKDFYSGILPPLLVVSFISILILMENDFSTAFLILLIAFFMFLLSGAEFLSLLILVFVGSLTAFLGVFFAPYRIKRLTSFINPWGDPLNTGWQYIQSMKCFSLGGFWGKGIGNSTQKYSTLPEARNDYIFAIVAEEGGAFFAIIIVLLFTAFAIVGLLIARNTKEDRYRFLLASGITMFIFFQAMINIGVSVGVLPSTGIQLPFVSSGGTSIVAFSFCIGMLINSLRIKKI
jgi:cell division protein FtsW